MPIHPFFLSNLWQSLIFFFTVSIILPFPKCHVIEIIQCVASLTEKAMAPHCTTLAWKIPWTEEPGRLQSMGSYRVGHDWSDLAAAAASLNTIPKAQSMKERTTQLWNRPKTLTDTIKEDIHTAKKHEHMLYIMGYRKMQIKIIGKYYNTQIRMVKIQNIESVRCWWGYEAIGNVGIQNHTNHTASMEDGMVISYKSKHIFNNPSYFLVFTQRS